MNSEIQKLEKRLADARTVQAAMNTELDKTAGELDRLDVTVGDIDEAVEKKLKLQAKKDILEKRSELANQAVKQLEGDLLIERAGGLKAQVKALELKLRNARETAERDLMKLIRPGELDLHEKRILSAFIDIHREVQPLAVEVEALTRQYNHAENCAASARRERIMAESAEIHAAQEAVFNGEI